MQSIDLILLLNVRIALQNEQTGCISVADRTEFSSLGHGMIWHAPKAVRCAIQDFKWGDYSVEPNTTLRPRWSDRSGAGAKWGYNVRSLDITHRLFL